MSTIKFPKLPFASTLLQETISIDENRSNFTAPKADDKPKKHTTVKSVDLSLCFLEFKNGQSFITVKLFKL